MSRGFERRGFLASMLTGAACLPAQARTASGPPIARRLAALLSDQDSAQAIGRTYLALAPNENNLETLVAALVKDQRQVATSEQLKDAVNKLVREDFEHNRIIELDGWMLSVSETRLCAICCLVG